MCALPGGAFVAGSDDHYPEEAPAHRVRVDAFLIDRAAVTNAAFERFVAATGYRTVAERPLNPADYPGAPAENLVPGSLVFTGAPGPVDLRHLSQWWTWVPGACWNRPEGPGSTVEGRGGHPVVQVAHEDAAAYAAWAGKRLPTEAEWEYAARGGLDHAEFVWGDRPESSGERLANYWHGAFPWRADPGYGRTRPVGSFPANGFGLVDMAGNVWEWTDDWYAPRRRPDGDAGAESGCCTPDNPRGGTREGSLDPAQPQFDVPRKVVKGGSFLCADSYCLRYRPAARRPQPIDTGMSHVGFRCAASVSRGSVSRGWVVR
jgi:formylglycine-generating enzyme required for sulfatase activity